MGDLTDYQSARQATPLGGRAEPQGEPLGWQPKRLELLIPGAVQQGSCCRF